MNRSPPYNSRKLYFVEELERLAEDDSHGYSQKPPNGRWGPDYDCSSLVYQAANNAGYNVGVGGDKVRFTGTMLKDFEKAGFQILPFANVGISDLKIGDILLNLALHAEVYVGEGQTIAATGSETGGYVGEAGDQTGQEIEKHPVTTFTKEWDYILRPPEDDNENDQNEYREEDDSMPMNYGPNMNNPMPTQGYNSMNQPWNRGNYPQGYNGYNQGYPQGGNLGQMNGYSQANAGYPQGGYQQNMMGPQGMNEDLCFVMGMEGAKNIKGAPNTRKAVFDEDKPLMYIVSFDGQGNVNNINVYQFEECSEEMPQHLSPLMQQTPMGNSQNGMMVSRDELRQMIKEVLDESTSGHGQSAQQRPNQSSGNGQQRNGRNAG